MSNIRIFVSSVQKELAPERASVAQMVAVDPFLLQHCEVVLYRPCSRNPLITQTLALLGQMEQRGTGFARMRDAMLDHGLVAPSFTEQDGYFIVTLPGPNGDYDRLRVPADAPGLIAPGIEAKLSPRQHLMVASLLSGEELTSRDCQVRFKVSAQALHRDFQKLVALNLARAIGSGRGVRYALKVGGESSTESSTDFWKSST